MNEDTASRFHRLRRRAELAASLAAGGLLGLLLLTGAARALSDTIGQLAARLDSPAAGRTLAIGAMVLALGILLEAATFPWVFYRGFVLERRYARSRERLADWLRDHLVALTLGLAFAVAAGVTICASVAVWPASWWLPVTAAFGVFSLMMTYAAPTVVMPLFYRFTPRVRDPLRERLLALVRRAGARVVDVCEWHLGAKSRTANAALIGLLDTRRIVVSDTLLEGFSDDEIEVIVAHEVAHHVHHDIWAALAVEVSRAGLGLFVAQSASDWLGPRLGLAGPGDLAGLPLVALVVGAVGMATAPAVHAISRAQERRADRFALDLTGSADAFVSAMRRLATQNLAEEQPSRVVEALFHTHPPLWRRLAAVRAWQARAGRVLTSPPGEPAPGPAGVRGCAGRGRRSGRSDDQLADHLATALVDGQRAVDREPPRLVGTELEHDRLARRRSLGDPIGVDRETVGDVLAGEDHLHEVVLDDFDAGGTVLVSPAGHADLDGLSRRRPRR